MTVSELIEVLKKADPEATVFIYQTDLEIAEPAKTIFKDSGAMSGCFICSEPVSGLGAIMCDGDEVIYEEKEDE